jgi:hypothetical protein
MSNFKIDETMKYFKNIRILIVAAFILTMTACDYLDLVPEGDPTIETAFSNKVNTKKYLYTCYSYLPSIENRMFRNPAMIGGDELWWDHDYWIDVSEDRPGIAIASGYQEANNPWQNYWDGSRGGTNLFQAIRDCNIFLENIDRPYDIDDYERARWAAEVKFLKAYYHFFLLRLYGPIPIIRENLPVSATPAEVRLYRDPVEEVIEYIVELLDEAFTDLPIEIQAPVSEAGRITKPIAKAVKAQALVWNASPLFNNDEYSNFTDNRGIQLIPSWNDAAVKAKWERAATAVKEAIDVCTQARHALYQYQPPALASLSPETEKKLELRGIISDKYNSEIIWPSTRSTSEYQHYCVPVLEAGNYNNYASEIGATLRMAELYYTKNGLPIDEDPTWNYNDRYKTQRGAADHQYYIGVNQITANLNFNREPRFYASLGHDRGIYEGSGRTDESNYFCLEARQGEASGMRSQHDHIVTGYYVKKIVHPESAFASSTSNGFNSRAYSFPIIRLADLYLLYAEALNEANGPSAEVYRWIDILRTRAGIPTVLESYEMAAPQFRSKPSTKEGLREIIKRERLIELAFEGQRFYDLRRWKDALAYYNQPIRGWNYLEDTAEKYYTIITVWDKRVFTTRDYLWPLSTHAIVVNANLEQNPGW